MKKILFSTTSFNIIDNGPALFANILYEALKSSDTYDIRFITEDIKLEEKRPKLYQLNLKQNTFNRFLYQFFRIFKYHKAAKKINSEFNFEVVVYNNAFTGVLSSLFLKKRVIVMVNDDNKIAARNNPLSLKKSYFKNKILFYLEKIAVQKADVIIVNSKFMKSQIENNYFVDENKLRILIKGIDLNNYRFNPSKDFNNSIHILFVKADYKRGGLFDLVDAISLIKDNNIKLTVIGPPNNELNLIEKYIKKSGLQSFKVIGPTHPNEVKKYLNCADIFCVPSYKEALGVANMEALASGLSVISTNVGGIPEVLDNGECGWLVEPGNPKMLAEAINECITNDALRIKKSEYGFQYVQQFDSKNLVKNFLNIIDDVKR
ncbi:glycosyltransferase family 4 protein [Flavobacterium sp.]|uniref:glycosyltransferase family 4 protein n=1 Tax=Flavobacterium sp. TaxID=239 RepID=UPI004047D887